MLPLSYCVPRSVRKLFEGKKIGDRSNFSLPGRASKTSTVVVGKSSHPLDSHIFLYNLPLAWCLAKYGVLHLRGM